MKQQPDFTVSESIQNIHITLNGIHTNNFFQIHLHFVYAIFLIKTKKSPLTNGGGKVPWSATFVTSIKKPYGAW